MLVHPDDGVHRVRFSEGIASGHCEPEDFIAIESAYPDALTYCLRSGSPLAS
jgi:hypothetical protein